MWFLMYLKSSFFAQYATKNHAKPRGCKNHSKKIKINFAIFFAVLCEILFQSVLAYPG
jgi:hypothetical protein